MSAQVWLKFRAVTKVGSVIKLRIQDLPAGRIEDAAGLMTKYYARDEPCRKAFGFTRDLKIIEEYKHYILNVIRDPSTRKIICCVDKDNQTADIMGISITRLVQNTTKEEVEKATDDRFKEPNDLDQICSDVFDGLDHFNLMKKLNLPSFYAGIAMLVIPDYRGNRISEHFFKVRRLMCAAHGVPMTGAWLSSHGVQVAAKKDGWQTYFEVEYKEISRKYGVVIEDVPPTLKYMAVRPQEPCR